MISNRRNVRSCFTRYNHLPATLARYAAMVSIGGILAAASGCAAPTGGAGGEGSTQSASPPIVEKASTVQTESESCRPPFYECACYVDGEIETWCTTPSICWHVCPDFHR